MSTSHSIHYTNYINDPTPENNEQLTMINGQINQTNLRIKEVVNNYGRIRNLHSRTNRDNATRTPTSNGDVLVDEQ